MGGRCMPNGLVTAMATLARVAGVSNHRSGSSMASQGSRPAWWVLGLATASSMRLMSQTGRSAETKCWRMSEAEAVELGIEALTVRNDQFDA
jgi:hypothetical protein